MWCVFLGENVGEVVGGFCVFAQKSVHTKCGVVFLCRWVGAWVFLWCEIWVCFEKQGVKICAQKW
jgi:hypothetical protein